MALLKKLWSGADFWDKKENEKQRQQFAQQQAQQPQGKPLWQQAVQAATDKLPGVSAARALAPKLINPVETGLARSLTGGAQGLSGLYDLATPGKGTNRFTKATQTMGAQQDQFVKNNGLNRALYKGGQLGGEALQFIGPGMAVDALAGANKVGKVVQGGRDIKAGAGLLPNASNFATKGLNWVTKPANLANIATNTIQNAGYRTAQGQDNNLKTLGTDLATSVAFGGALEGAGKGVSFVGNKVQANLANRIARSPRPLTINEGVPARVQQPLNIKAGVPLARDPRTPRPSGLRIVDNSVPQPNKLKIVDNSVPAQPKGAVLQAMLGKAKQFNQSLGEGGYVANPFYKGDTPDVPKGNKWITPLPDNGPTPIPKKLDSNGVQIQAGDKIEFYGASPDGKKGTTTIRWEGPYKANASGKEFPGQWLGNGTLNNNIPFKIIERDGEPFNLTAKNLTTSPKITAPMDTNKLAKELADQNRLQRAMNGDYAPDAPSTSLKQTRPEIPASQSSKTPTLQMNKDDIQVPSVNRTPRQLEIKESTAPFSNEQQKIVKDYADMLKTMGEGNGVSVNKEGKRISNNVRLGDTKGKTRVDWQAEAERQLRSGKAEPNIQNAFKELDNPEFRSLAQSAEASTAKGSVGDKFETDPLEGFRQKIQQRSGEKNIPVRKMVKDGDTVVATNVNPNIKAGEKRYAVDDTGNLIEDAKGAYRVFTDGEGRVQNVRIGNKVYSSKDYGDLSDVNDYGSSLATMRRNVERGFGKETADKLSRFLVDDQQHRATQMIERSIALKKGLQNIADELGISFSKNSKKAKEVSAAIQNFGEGTIEAPQLVAQFGDVQAGKIIRADKWFKTQYDSLLNEMNKTLTDYGYPPVPKRNNYYTHFQDESLWKSFGLKMQEIKNIVSPTLQDASPNPTRGKISNKLAGESEFTQPNKRFNPFALQRKGTTYTADAFQAFERYLNPTLNNIYMTPSISRARVITKAIAQEADIDGKDANKIIIQTKEWANRLAGKTARADRPLVDSKGGQAYLKAAQWAQRMAGQNTIVGNLSTAVMQPILLSQTSGKFGFKNTILGAMQELSSAHGKTAPIRQSEFMRRRYADVMNVTASRGDKFRAGANKPLEVVEETSARITWNAAHNDALSKGITGKEAIRYADIEAEKTLAGRSIGERPEAFETKAAGPLTMYQLEVNNYWQQLGKEMTKGQAAKMMVAAYGLNILLQNATGRQVGFNPIDAAIDSYQETQKEEKTPQEKTKAIAQRVGGEFVDNIPFAAQAGTLAFGESGMKKVFGPSSNVGRFGSKSAISSLTTNPLALVAPGGAGQVKKTYEGGRALLDGGINNKDGERTVDIPRTPANIVRGLAFGKNAIPEVNAYYNNIGLKKPDQKTVPNQISSEAGNQGLQGLTKQQQEILANQVRPEDRDKFRQQFIAENKKGRTLDKEKDSLKKTAQKTGKLSDGSYYGKVGENFKTYTNEQEYNIAKQKYEFKNSKDNERTIGGVKYRKGSNGSVVKASIPKPKKVNTPKASQRKTSSGNTKGKGSKVDISLLTKAKAIETPKIRKSNLSVKAPTMPKMASVKTPRVASRPRNTANVTSRKTYLA
jgi:hypothetical protein